MGHDSEWWLRFYNQYGHIIDQKQYDVSIPPARPGPYELLALDTESRIIEGIYCNDVITMCTTEQQIILRLILEDYRIVDIARELDKGPMNISQSLARIRERLLLNGVGPHSLKG